MSARRSSPNPSAAWTPAIDADGQPRDGAEVCELTGWIDLHTWPAGTRVICRREDAHPGAQLRFSDHDGHRFQVFLTDQPDPDLARLELRHRQRARVEDRIRAAKATGLANLPFDRWRRNSVWLELVLAAQDLTVWTQALLLDGDLAVAEPKTLRYRLLHVAARIVRHARRVDPAPATLLAMGGRARQGVRPAAGPAAALLSRPAAPTIHSPATGTPPCPRSRSARLPAGAAAPAPPRPAAQPSQDAAHTTRPAAHATATHALMKSRG